MSEGEGRGEGVACPFCGSENVELLAPFGSQHLTSQYRCADCRSYFEAVRADFDEREERAGSGGR